MSVKVNGEEISKEDFVQLILKRKKQYEYIKRMSKTELGRETLKRKGIKPITEEKRE